MCPPDLTNEYREALASNPDNVVYIDTLTFNHSTFPAPFRIALSDKDITLDGDLYAGSQFKSTLPTVQSKASGGMQLSIEDINFSLGALLDDALASSEPMSLLWKSFLSTEVSAQAQFIKTLEVSSVRLNGRSFSIIATYPDIVNKRLPVEKYSANDFPGLR